MLTSVSDARAFAVRFAHILCVVFACAVGMRAERAASVASDASAAAMNVSAAWHADVVRTIDPTVFSLALKAAQCALTSGAIANLTTLTVIDYSKPSTENRLWVFDVGSRALLYEELVAHGQGSGANFATMFSNEPDTHRSSIGLFETGTTYVGRNGYSLRLRGLEEGFNDKAGERAIVMHGAPYVSREFAREHGRLGRSWGCPALSSGIAREVIDVVKGSGLVFAYYPDERWLAASKFLGRCASPTRTGQST